MLNDVHNVASMGLLLAAVLPRSRPKTQEGYGTLLKSLAILWREEPELRRATIIQGGLFGSFSALWTILALQLDTRYHLSAEVAGLFGIIGAVGVLVAPIAGKIADRRGPHTVIGLGSVIMLTSWVVFEVWGMIAGLSSVSFCWIPQDLHEQNSVAGMADGFYGEVLARAGICSV